MQDEGRRVGLGLDLRDRRAQRRGDVRVGRLVEADVAVADLHEAESPGPCAIIGGCAIACPSGAAFNTPPDIVQTAPVPTHAMHFRKCRRSSSCSSSCDFTIALLKVQEVRAPDQHASQVAGDRDQGAGGKQARAVQPRRSRALRRRRPSPRSRRAPRASRRQDPASDATRARVWRPSMAPRPAASRPRRRPPPNTAPARRLTLPTSRQRSSPATTRTAFSGRRHEEQRYREMHEHRVKPSCEHHLP